jgi:hypothetical protein
VKGARHWWLTPVILATKEAQIRRIIIRSQPRQIVRGALSRKYPSQKRVEWLKVQALSSNFSTAKQPPPQKKTAKEKMEPSKNVS